MSSKLEFDDYKTQDEERKKEIRIALERLKKDKKVRKKKTFYNNHIGLEQSGNTVSRGIC